MNNVNASLRALDRGGVSDIAYTAFRNIQTGETRYIDSDGAPVSQAVVDAQTTAREALGRIPEVTAEEILRDMSDDGNQHLAGQAAEDDDTEFLEVASPQGKDDGNGGKDDETDGRDDGNDADDDNSESETPQIIGQKHGLPAPADATPNKRVKQGGKTLKTSAARPTPPAGSRKKRWSETKSWKKIIEAEERGECPDDIDDLVQDAEQLVQKSMKGKYLATVEKLKVVGYDSKVAELESAKEEIL
jgi:hypothetical protein